MKSSELAFSQSAIEIDPALTDWLKAEYQGMKLRCENDDHKFYHIFGGSGIKVKWNSFELFETFVLSKLGSAPIGTKIIRIDKYKHFEEGNIRWATLAT